MLSWALDVAERHQPPVHAFEGMSDVCDEMWDLVERLKATFADDGKILNMELVEWEQDDGEDEDQEE